MITPTGIERPQPRRSSLAVVTNALFLAAVGWGLVGTPGSAAADSPATPETAGVDEAADVDEAVALSLAEEHISGTMVPLIEREGGPWERFAQNPSANPLRIPNLDPGQAGNIDRSAGQRLEGPGGDGPSSIPARSAISTSAWKRRGTASRSSRGRRSSCP